MTASDYAAEELALWEEALREQREAERRLELARQPPYPADFYELLQEVDNLRSRADLLLAEAVKVKCACRDASLRAERRAGAGPTSHPKVAPHTILQGMSASSLKL